jgi:hypothetical protein
LEHLTLVAVAATQIVRAPLETHRRTLGGHRVLPHMLAPPTHVGIAKQGLARLPTGLCEGGPCPRERPYWRLVADVPFVDQQVEAHQIHEGRVTHALGLPVPSDLNETVGDGNML